MTTPGVSVVITCFNLGAYLDEAVQSVLDQTYQNFEILIVDDGSDDSVTRLLLASYRRPKTRIIPTTNSGVARARNLGLGEARGAYVSFLDADDLLEPTFLEKAVALLESDSSRAFASCWLKAFGQAEFSWTPERCDFPHLLAEDTVCTAALMQRDLVTTAGGFDDDPRIDGYEDWELPVRLVAQGNQGLIIPEFLFRYRIRLDSKSAARTTLPNHARVMEYMVEKHADLYRRQSEGVIEVIGQRIEALEEIIPDPPPRPVVETTDWQTKILTLENHRRALEELTRIPEPLVGDRTIEWGSFRRLAPISRVWGLDRGRPVDRYYIERFLEEHRIEIAGAVLEVKDAAYAQRFGERLESIDIIDIASHNEAATIVADLSKADALPVDRFDCFILTQTLHFVYEAEQVVRNAFSGLRPGGVLLATLPCLSRLDYEPGIAGDFWRFTPASARRLFEGVFGTGSVDVQAFGSVLTCTAFIQGLAAEDLDQEELDHRDPYFPLIVAVRAVKPRPWAAAKDVSQLEGFHDSASCTAIAGWAWDPTDSERRLCVDIWDGAQRLGSAWADRYRPDLAAAGKADGRLSFVFVPSRDLHEATSHPIRVTVAGTEHALASTPLPLECVCGRSEEAVGDPGLPARTGPRPRGEPAAAVLLYHRVGPAAGDTQRLCTEPDAFRAHMELITERYVPMPLAELTSAAAERRMPPGAVAVTFDDGYLDNLELAVPVLTELGIPATFFVIAEALKGPLEPWWDLLERTLLAQDQLPNKLWLDAPGGNIRLPTRTHAERRLALHIVRELLTGSELGERNVVMRELAGWRGDSREPTFRQLMTADEVARLASLPGHEVGAHTVHHLLLPAQPDDVKRRELADSRSALERLLDRPVRSLAYPYGGHDATTRALTRELGFERAVTVEETPVAADIDPFRIPRLDVCNEEIATFEKRLANALPSSHRARS